MPLSATPSPRLSEALALLQQHARPVQLDGMARFGIAGAGRLGVSIPALRALARSLGRDHALALALWDTGIPDARILASMLSDPAQLTARQMDQWSKGFDSWDVCDQTCMNAFVRSPLAWRKVPQWAKRGDEFVRRAAFALLACLATHDKRAPDSAFIDALAWIEAAASDERNFVKKAVNWALRGIGKRNAALRDGAIACALRIQQQGSKPARWIAADALRELSSQAVQKRHARRSAPKK